jgi:hypothetical protein
MVTTKIFGAGSTTEVRTANTVAGVRGTTFIVSFVPPDVTEVDVLDGVVAVRNPNLQPLEPVPANFRTQVIGNAPPGLATALSATERQARELELRLTEQIPTEVKPVSERQATGPIREEPITAGLTTTGGPLLPSIALLPADIQPGALTSAAQLEQLVSRTCHSQGSAVCRTSDYSTTDHHIG